MHSMFRLPVKSHPCVQTKNRKIMVRVRVMNFMIINSVTNSHDQRFEDRFNVRL